VDPQTVLIADDDPLERKLLSIHLTQMGLRVITAQDGVEALEKARQSRPDAVISDVLMPRLDGFRLCQTLKRDSTLATVPVVLTSAASIEESDRVLARNMGADAFVVRTPDCREILVALQKSLNEQPVSVPPSTDALVDGLREEFLAEGNEKVRTLLDQLESGFNPVGWKQLAHRWAGVGGTLGFLQISQRAYQIEQLLDRPLDQIALQLRVQLEEIAHLFSDARPAGREATPGPELIQGLAGTRIALVGFDPPDAAKLSRALAEAQAISQIFPAAAAPPPDPFDLLVLHLGPPAEHPAQAGPRLWAASGSPLLVIGPRDRLLGEEAELRERASDFLLSPWYTEEVALRACRILSKHRAGRPAADRGQDFRVVVADDDLEIDALVAAALENYGIHCQIARHGGEALEMTRRLLPDALVLDINMPRLDGFQVLTALKSAPETRRIPVLLLTARRQEADILRGFGLGAEDYVVKPFNPIELVARLKRLFASREPGRA
jgi:DNA-binding response OmpR family regulator